MKPNTPTSASWDPAENDMGEPTVGDVMSRHIRTAVPDTPFKELAAIMVTGDITAVPVIDEAGHPVGLVSEDDLLAKLEYHDGADRPTLLAGSQSRTRWRKSSALTAADLMTTPAVTTADLPVSAAARHLATQHMHALCVVDPTNLLIGLLTHRDALTLYLRSDHAIQTDLEREIKKVVRDPRGLTVRVVNGIVTLDGTVRLRSEADRVGYLAHHTHGVIHVHNNLASEYDDTLITGL
jgi:CBS-domain-containing membrane protein